MSMYLPEPYENKQLKNLIGAGNILYDIGGSCLSVHVKKINYQTLKINTCYALYLC